MTRVLWVTEELPDRRLGGGSIRQAHLLTALASTFTTDLLVTGEVADQAVLARVASVTDIPKCRLAVPDGPVGRRLFEMAVTLRSPYPLPAYLLAPSRLLLGRAIAAMPERYDAVCVEHEALAPLVENSRGERWILTFHHVLSGMVEKEIALASGRRQQWFRKRELGKARRLEQRALLSYDRCVVCSEEDASALAALGSGDDEGRISVIPNGVDLAAFAPTPLPPEPRILFPGTLNYAPNVDAALWFTAAIWPRIRTEVRDARLAIVGRAPVGEVRALDSLPGVEVHADVPSMAPHFASARLVVVPLRVGTGTRLKALEAMASGRPVIGTSVGLEGIGIVDGVQARLADAPEAFARAVVRTLRDADVASALADSARAHVESRFGWEAIAHEFVATVSELLERPRRDLTPLQPAQSRRR